MLTIYRRHLGQCRKKTRRNKSCSCPIWVQGRLHGELMRKSLGIRNWEAAQKLVRAWEAREQGARVSFVDAFGRFLADCQARNLSPETIYKYRSLGNEMNARFDIRPLESVTVHALAEYRESWTLAPLTAWNKIDRIRVFFNFCVQRGWIDKNPALFLKPPKVTQTPTLPFSDDDIEKIRDAVEEYPDRPKGRRGQIKALVLLLMHTGLRIRDAVTVAKNKIEDGKLLLYTAKTGQPVWIPLPGEVLEAMEGLDFRPFWSGNGTPKSAVAAWQRSFKMLFSIAAVKGHAHQFRDYFAVTLLTRGVPLEDVAILLGHSSVKITEKHYAPWVKVRQARLEDAVRRAWSSR